MDNWEFCKEKKRQHWAAPGLRPVSVWAVIQNCHITNIDSLALASLLYDGSIMTVLFLIINLEGLCQ